ncbi:MAG: hypothetical protein AB1689_17280 [Thermodesulfobacteriota bacterium]
MRRRAATALAGLVAAALAAGCEGSLLLGGVSFAPWMGCAAGGVLVAYVGARLLEARLFAYDARYFVWTFLSLATLCSVALWWLLARPVPG